MIKQFIKITFNSVVLLFLATTILFAAPYPSKVISVVVPSKAGGSTDTTARLFMETAKKYLKGSKFKIVNKPGSGGLIGFEYIYRSKSNGYTLGMIFTPQFVAHIVSKKAKYKLSDFTILGNAAFDPGIIVVNSQSSIKSLDDLVALAKSKKLTGSVNGIGSDDFLAAKNFEEANNILFNIVPTKGSTEQKTAILGNHVDVAFMNLSQMLSNHKAGKARILALLDTKRATVAPDIPTAKELGYNTLMTATRGFVVRKNVPANIKTILQKLVANVLADKNFKARAEKSFIFLNPLSGKEYTDYLKQLQVDVQKVYDKSPW